MKKFQDLTVGDFPGIDENKFYEWKSAVQNANTYTALLFIGLVVVNVILFATTGSLMLGGLLLLLPIFFINRKPNRLARELGITRQKIKEARLRPWQSRCVVRRNQRKPMNGDIKTKLKVLGPCVSVIFILLACGHPSGPAGSQSTAMKEEDIETKLRGALANPSAVVVVKDTTDLYWAIPVSGIKEISKNVLTVKEKTRIAAGSGKGLPQVMANLLINQRSSGGPYFVSNSGETSVTGQVGETNKVTTIEVKEIILSK